MIVYWILNSWLLNKWRLLLWDEWHPLFTLARKRSNRQLLIVYKHYMPNIMPTRPTRDWLVTLHVFLHVRNRGVTTQTWRSSISFKHWHRLHFCPQQSEQQCWYQDLYSQPSNQEPESSIIINALPENTPVLLQGSYQIGRVKTNTIFLGDGWIHVVHACPESYARPRLWVMAGMACFCSCRSGEILKHTPTRWFAFQNFFANSVKTLVVKPLCYGL